MLRVGSFRHTQLSPQHSPNMSPQLSPLASNMSTPRDSPFQSATNSPNISPTNSPMALRRATNYKHKSRKSQHRGTTEEIIRRKKDVCRTRSKSTPSLPGDFIQHNDNKRCLSTQSSFSEGSFSDERDFHSSTETISSKTSHKKDKHGKSPALRKKSIGAIIGASLGHLDIKSDLKKIIDHAPKLRRSNSHRSTRSKQKEYFKDQKTSFSDEDNENYDGPLFHAITLFVPGYDFKTKQATPTVERKQSTPIFGRRGSKEKAALQIFNRNSKERLSVPNLSVRRGSKEKIKKADPKRYSDHFIQTEKFSNDIVNKLKIEAKKKPSIANDDEFISVTERQNMIKDRFKKFENLGKNSKTKIEVPKEKLEGKVKKLSGAFESGKAFIKSGGADKKLGKTYSMDPNLVRDRTSSFESGKFVKSREGRSRSELVTNTTSKTTDSSFTVTNINKRFSYSTESGYNSPNDISEDFGLNGELPSYVYKNIPSYVYDNHKPVIKYSDILYEDSFSNSWSQGQWTEENKSYQFERIPSANQIYSTDLCVTEL